MSMTLTGLIPIIYQARDRVARELVGMIPAVTIDSDAAQAAVGQTVRSFVSQPTTLTNITPSNVVPNSGGQTLVYKDIVINNSQAAPIQWTGEEQRSVGAQFDKMLTDQFAQSFRTIANAVELSLLQTATAGASRAVGTAGVTPFANTLSTIDAANTAQVLDDNGTPPDDRHLVVSTSTFRNLASSPYLFKVNESGNDDLLRRGTIGQLEGFSLGKTGQSRAAKHFSGLSSTANAYSTSGANVIGDTAITADVSMAGANSGDVVVFAGDTSQYVVGSGSGSVLTLNNPGLFNTALSNAAFTSVGNYTPNFGFHRSAILLAARAPLMPAGGDAASDVILVEDEASGLVYQIAMYKAYRQMHIEVGLAWGSLAVKSEFITILLG